MTLVSGIPGACIGAAVCRAGGSGFGRRVLAVRLLGALAFKPCTRGLKAEAPGCLVLGKFENRVRETVGKSVPLAAVHRRLWPVGGDLSTGVGAGLRSRGGGQLLLVVALAGASEAMRRAAALDSSTGHITERGWRKGESPVPGGLALTSSRRVPL